jgi:D-sedoheptulose 7-phosphate isomerase
MRKELQEYINTHKELVNNMDVDIVLKISDIIYSALKNGGILYLCGNGGSAADAQHIAGEFLGRFKLERDPLPAVALTTDSSTMTCILNDYSSDEVFSRQIDALIKKADILWAFSTSGASKNILLAANHAKKKGATLIAFTGKKNSKLEKISDICFCANTLVTSSAQELHQLAYHMICMVIDKKAYETRETKKINR